MRRRLQIPKVFSFFHRRYCNSNLVIEKVSLRKVHHCNIAMLPQSPFWIQFHTPLLGVHTYFGIITLGSHIYFLIDCFMHCLYSYKLLYPLFIASCTAYSYRLMHPIFIASCTAYTITNFRILFLLLHALPKVTEFGKAPFLPAYTITNCGIISLCLMEFQNLGFISLCLVQLQTMAHIISLFPTKLQTLASKHFNENTTNFDLFCPAYTIIDCGFLSCYPLGLQTLTNIFFYLVKSQTMVAFLVQTMPSQILLG